MTVYFLRSIGKLLENYQKFTTSDSNKCVAFETRC